MLSTTLEAIKAILKADPSITPSERLAVVECIRERGKAKKSKASEIKLPNRIMRRGEVAKLFSRNVRAIDRLAQSGVLQKVRLPGSKKCLGFRSHDVERLIGALDADAQPPV